MSAAKNTCISLYIVPIIPLKYFSRCEIADLKGGYLTFSFLNKLPSQKDYINLYTPNSIFLI